MLRVVRPLHIYYWLIRTNRFVAVTCTTSSLSTNSNGKTNSEAPTKIQWSMEWRKIQLDNLENKFSVDALKDGNELQSTWKDMEGRVTKRRPQTLDDTSKTGRSNVRKTEEDVWLQHGLYDGTDKLK